MDTGELEDNRVRRIFANLFYTSGKPDFIKFGGVLSLACALIPSGYFFNLKILMRVFHQMRPLFNTYVSLVFCQ